MLALKDYKPVLPGSGQNCPPYSLDWGLHSSVPKGLQPLHGLPVIHIFIFFRSVLVKHNMCILDHCH